MRISDWSSDVCSSDLDDDGNPEEQHRRQFGRQREEVSDAAYASDNVTQGDGNSSAHYLFDDRRVCGEAGGDFRWPVFFKESGCQPEQIGLNCRPRSEEHTSELQSLMRISYAVFCLKK